MKCPDSKKFFLPINTYMTLPHPASMDRLALVQLLSSDSVAAVANAVGVSRGTIYRWCKQSGIPRRVYGCPDRQMLQRMESSGVLQKHIARYFGVSRWTIRNWCQRYGIVHHTTGCFLVGANRNTLILHEEPPFGIGVLFGSNDD